MGLMHSDTCFPLLIGHTRHPVEGSSLCAIHARPSFLRNSCLSALDWLAILVTCEKKGFVTGLVRIGDILAAYHSQNDNRV